MTGPSTQPLARPRTGLRGRLADPTTTSVLMAALERVVNRGAGAVVGVVMVFFVSPREMGLYAGAFLAYTFAAALGDSAIRVSAPPFWFASQGRDLLHRVSAFGAVISCVTVAGFAAAVRLTGAASPRESLMVLSLCLAGVFSCAALPRVTYAEAQGRWSFLARQQTVAAVGSIVVGAALVPVLGIGGGFAQTIVCEGLFLLRVPRPGAELGDGEPAQLPRALRRIGHVSVTNLLGWVQGQAERIAIAVFAGPVLLGYYAVAFQLARSLSDPAATGLMSWLRNNLSKPDADQRSVYDASIRRGSVLGVALQAVALVCLVIPASLVVPHSWHESIRIAVVLSASLPLLMVQWSMSAMIIAQHRTRELFPWQIAGVVVTVGCGLLMASYLWAGVVALVVRDVLMTLVRGWLTRSDLAPRSRWAVVLVGAVGVLLAAAGWLLTTWTGHLR